MYKFVMMDKKVEEVIIATRVVPKGGKGGKQLLMKPHKSKTKARSHDNHMKSTHH
jgi:hypothetical protein